MWGGGGGVPPAISILGQYVYKINNHRVSTCMICACMCIRTCVRARNSLGCTRVICVA